MTEKPRENRWRQADQLFDQALDLEAEERDAFLKDACQGDPELRALMDRLLAETAGDDPFFTPGGGMAGPLVDELVDDMEQREAAPPGSEIGSYRVVRELGRGGMAVVHLAERADGQFEQQVALKLIKRGTDTDEVIQRFDQERQILALVRHPSIAQLLDGGVGPDGRPFFAMEYVDGQPIDRYCDENKLSVEQRLRLFLRIARAVSYAHRNLVVHRDLKPSNILVSKDGHPKLLDFGIAKLLDPNAAPGKAPETRTHARLMTPAFASPEQIRGAPVTTASDIYQLGLLLYLLLTGRWPYRYGSGDAAADVVRAICEDDPTRPSLVLDRRQSGIPDGSGQDVQETSEILTARQTPLGRLRRELSGDLDRIVLMAMRKEPERRYSSVAQLIDDIERYLAGRPVAAQTDTFLYRASKFVRRHAAASLITLGALILFATFAVVHTVQLTRERDRAQAAAARATQVASFLRGLFEIAAPTRSRGEQITARQLLEDGAQRLERDLANQPDLLADMKTVIGDVYRELALYAEAGPLLRSAVALRWEALGEDRAQLAHSLYALGRLTEDEGNLDQALEIYQDARQIREHLYGPTHPDVARAIDGIGRVLAEKAQYPEALEHHQRALQTLEAELGSEHVEVGLTLKNIGYVYRRTRDFEQARDFLARAVTILTKHYGDHHPHLADAQMQLGDALRFSDNAAAAREQYELALVQTERAYGQEHPEVAKVLDRLGNLFNASDSDAAIVFHKRALTIREHAFGQEHPDVAASLNNLGLAYRRVSAEESQKYFLRSAEVLEAVYGPDHVEVAKPLKQIGAYQRYIGNLSDAVETYERVLAIREKTYGSQHSFLAEPLYEIGRLHREMGDPRAAEPLLRRALALASDRETLARSTLRAEIELGRCLIDLERYSEAETRLTKIAETPGIEPVYRCRSLQAMGDLYALWNRPQLLERRQQQLEAEFTDNCWPRSAP